MVLKVAPPLVVTDAQLDAFVLAVRDVVELLIRPEPSGPKPWDWRGGPFAVKLPIARCSPIELTLI